MSARGPNLDQRLLALTLPRFTAGGVEYVGRPASFEQILRWGAAAQTLGAAMQAGEPGVDAALTALLLEMADALFPAPPPPPWWRRWTRVPAAAEVLAGMPPVVQFEVLQGFCAALSTMTPRSTAPGPE